MATATGTAGYSYDTVTASATGQIHSLFGTVGFRGIEYQFGNSMSITPGMYWLGLLRRESNSSAGIGMSFVLPGNQMGMINSMGPVGAASSANTTQFAHRDPYNGFGVYSSTGSAGYGGTALPSSVFLSGIAHTLSVMPLMSFIST
jgi:hypothetical protein